jgi:hypothetical protein
MEFDISIVRRLIDEHWAWIHEDVETAIEILISQSKSPSDTENSNDSPSEQDKNAIKVPGIGKEHIVNPPIDRTYTLKSCMNVEENVETSENMSLSECCSKIPSFR